MTLEIERVEQFPVLVIHLGQRHLHVGFLAASLVDHADLANGCKAVDELGRGDVEAPFPDLAVQEADEHQRQDAAQDVDADLLIGPVILEPQGDVSRVLHLPECGFHVMLGAVSADDFGVAPVVIVGEDEGFSQQGFLEVLPFVPVEPIGENRQTVAFCDVDLEELLHVAGLEPLFDLLPGSLDGWRRPAIRLSGVPASQRGLEVAQMAAAFRDLALQGAGLGIEQVPVPGDDDGPFGAEQMTLDAARADAVEVLERGEAFGGHVQQVAMVRGDEGTGEVVGSLVDGGDVVRGIVALVEDQRDVLDLVGDVAASRDESVDEACECRRVVLVSRKGVMEERQVAVARDQEREADDAQGLSALLAVSALREFRRLVVGVDEGEEVRCVEEDATEIDIVVLDHPGDDVAFDAGDVVFLDAVHVVPEALARELVGIDAEQAGENGLPEPVGDCGLGARRDAAIEDGDEDVGSDGGA